MLMFIWFIVFALFMIWLGCVVGYAALLVLWPILKASFQIVGGLFLLALCGIFYALWALVWFLWVVIDLCLGKTPPPFLWRPQARPELPVIRNPTLPALKNPRI